MCSCFGGLRIGKFDVVHPIYVELTISHRKWPNLLGTIFGVKQSYLSIVKFPKEKKGNEIYEWLFNCR